MKESKFIAQNKKNWIEFEKDLRVKQNIATRLSKLFIQVTDDLSYSRTFYKNRSVRVYLNGLAQKLFNGLYRNQKSSQNSFVNFWKTELPLRIYEARREFLIAFVVFVGAFLIGIMSSFYDKDFAKIVLGDDYINMTLENIEKKDPMAVYKSANQIDMFLGITINNLTVALSTFAFGFFFAVGSLFRLIYNGIMVGVFQYFFIERGLFKESFLTIWQHGTLEISCIIIAAAAGITLGKGLLFPGTFTRTESFKMSAVRGLKIFVGIVPIIIMAAFIEGFFTRYTEIGTPFRVMVILVSLGFVVAYFVIYPRKVAKTNKLKFTSEDKVNYKPPFYFDFSRILDTEEIMGYTLEYFNRVKFKLLSIAAVMALFHGLLFVLYEKYLGPGISVESLSIFKNDGMLYQLLLGIVDVFFLLFYFGIQISKHVSNESNIKRRFTLRSFINSLIISLFLAGLLYVLKWYILLVIIFIPVLFLLYYQSAIANSLIFTQIGNTFNLLVGSWGKLLWGSIKITFLFFILYVLSISPIAAEYLQSVLISFSYDTEIGLYIRLFFGVFILLALIMFYFIFQICTTFYSYYAFSEVVYAKSLLSRIKVFGVRNSMFGFEKEQGL